MEKFYFEEPSLNRKNDAIDFNKEFDEFNSEKDGFSGLDKYINNYEDWLNKLKEDYTRIPNEEKVPARTYFLIRKYDNKIIGILNLRLCLNENLKKFAGNIGYSIRPTERGKGYNKINLYLGLIKAKEYGISKVLLDASKNNPASWKTMEALGGILIREYFDNIHTNSVIKDYEILVNENIEKYKENYKKIIIL